MAEHPVKHRIMLFLESKRMSQSRFEKKAGLSNGYVNKLLKSPSVQKMEQIVGAFPDLNPQWLLTGEGEMLKDSDTPSAATPQRPHLALEAAAGSLSVIAESQMADDVERRAAVAFFPSYDYTMAVRGDSMEPRFSSGDIVAFRLVDSPAFIQWGKVYVLDTSQGVVLKRVYDDGSSFRLHSENPAYPDFTIPKSEVTRMGLVVGSLRVE